MIYCKEQLIGEIENRMERAEPIMAHEEPDLGFSGRPLKKKHFMYYYDINGNIVYSGDIPRTIFRLGRTEWSILNTEYALTRFLKQVKKLNNRDIKDSIGF